MYELNAKQYVGTTFPPDEGAKLARALLKEADVDWNDLTVNLMGLPAGLLISAFFNGFLDQISVTKPEVLDTARRVKWKLDHAFQRENVSCWMRDFEPAH